ncbi:hypothetical protein [Spartinivicinus ruber]|uniref:hypothetical protein n=1 Tax=Spartinivicinus ruber TaxID=2683272 RepID=UPI0013D79553|nr:hypothetical protein [Spartinivicinus ruber]
MQFKIPKNWQLFEADFHTGFDNYIKNDMNRSLFGSKITREWYVFIEVNKDTNQIDKFIDLTFSRAYELYDEFREGFKGEDGIYSEKREKLRDDYLYHTGYKLS